MPPPGPVPSSCAFLGLRFELGSAWDNRASDGPGGRVGFDMALRVTHWTADANIRLVLPTDLPFLTSTPVVHEVTTRTAQDALPHRAPPTRCTTDPMRHVWHR